MPKVRILTFISLLILTLAGTFFVLNLNPAALSGVKATTSATGLALLPQNVDFVVHVDTKRALRSPLLNRILSDPEHLRNLDKFVQEIGIDPRQDIADVLVGGKHGGGAVAFIQGPALRERVLAFLDRQDDWKVQVETYKGYEILQSDSQGCAPGPHAVFFDNNWLALGDRAMLESTIDVHEGAASALNNPQLVSLLSYINQTDTFWMAGLNAAHWPPIEGWHLRSGNPPKLRNVVLSGNLDVALSVRAFGFFEDAETAKNCVAMARGLLAFAKMSNHQKSDELLALDGLTIADDQNRVILSVNIPYSVIDKLLEKERNVVTIR